MMLLPLSLLLRLFSFSIYVAGFVVTARLVRSAVLGEEPSWRSALFFLRSCLFRVVLFASAIFLLMAMATAGSASLLSMSKIFEGIQNRIGSLNFARIMMLPIWGVFSWIVAPFSFGLIQDESSKAIRQPQKRFGQVAAVTVAVIYNLASYLISEATPSINLALQSEIWIRGYVVWPAISILGELPLAFLWVFLAVLVFGDLESPEIPSPS